MRILHIRFCNLNSLAGAWTIDFTGQEYLSDGIFAITGPTGAGKSTILDALCLALYGRTPRLKLVSKSSNEIMTSHTGQCWSEVEFSTSRGRYRCHWSQHRARRVATGELQPPRHEIIDCGSGRPLETKIKMVAQKVVDVTGMSYEQFTRSILLAQGEFNAFLKAPPDERAPILEQITGTEIYSRISKKVHERKSAEILTLEQLTRELDGFTPLAEEQLAHLTATLEQRAAEAVSAQQQIQGYRQLLDWHLAQERLEKEITLQEQRLAECTSEWLVLEPERRLLARADQARSIEPEYRRLAEQRTLQETERQELYTITDHLGQLRAELQAALAAETTARETLQVKKQEAKVQETVLRQVRQLDQQLQMLDTQRAELSEELKVEHGRRQEIERAVVDLGRELAGIEKQLRELDAYRLKAAADSRLVEEYSGLHEQLLQYSELAGRRGELASRLPDLNEQRSRIRRLVDGRRRQTTELMAQRQLLDEQEAAQISQLGELLGGNALEQLYQQAIALQNQRHRLDQAQELAGRQVCREAELASLVASSATLASQRQEMMHRSQLLAEQLRLQQENVEKQQRIAQLAAKITSYEQERQLLRNGLPCPLCGSLSHPWHEEGTTPDEAAAHSELHRENVRLENIREQLAEARTALAATDKELELLDRTTAAYNRELGETRLTLTSLTKQLQLVGEARLQEELALLQTRCSSEMDEVQAKCAKAERLKKEVETAAHHRLTAAAACTESEQELQKLLQDQEKLDSQLRQHTAELAALEEAVAAKTSLLQQWLFPYTDRPLTAEAAKDLIQDLAERRAAWLESEKHQQLLDNHHRAKLAEQSSQKMLHARQLESCTEKEQRLTRLTASRQELALQRQELFGDKQPDAVENETLTQLETCERQLLAIADTSRHVAEKQTALATRKTLLEQRLTERTAVLQSLTETLTSALNQAGFQSEEDFLASCLAPEQRNQRQAVIDSRRKATETAQTLLQASRDGLQAERQRQLTDLTTDEISVRLDRQQELLASAQQETGALQQQLRDNARQRQQHGDKLQQIAAQRTELERWSRLHELIGSNDGKKFRNFAQGLTFEIMIRHANTSLRKMSDRYLLIRDARQPLELHVIDNYQGGEIRSTKNLSGGESFIVSMALALGLSCMASHNVQVDSLFLDEGFGTLDDESLQTALDTLAGLHQEGKIIGVISHVSGLRERIATRIKVTPGPGGRSLLAGPGVSKWQEGADG